MREQQSDSVPLLRGEKSGRMGGRSFGDPGEGNKERISLPACRHLMIKYQVWGRGYSVKQKKKAARAG